MLRVLVGLMLTQGSTVLLAEGVPFCWVGWSSVLPAKGSLPEMRLSVPSEYWAWQRTADTVSRVIRVANQGSARRENTVKTGRGLVMFFLYECRDERAPAKKTEYVPPGTVEA